MSWGKVRKDAGQVHIEGDATIIFPLLVLGAFSGEQKKRINEKINSKNSQKT